MSIIDKALGAVIPADEDKARAEVNAKARWAAAPGDWLSMALDHHDEIREAFETCRAAVGRSARVRAAKRLSLVLNGHALAEELVLYPALAQAGEKLPAGQAYVEQTGVKLQMAELERLDPATQAWLDKLEQIRVAVLHHMHAEEKGWFLDLKDKAEDQAYLGRRFQEEFERYVGAHGAPEAPAEARSFKPLQASTGELDRH